MLQIIDYSAKAIAVIGTTREDKATIADMKAMKGKYNRGLKCGAGWVFSKAKNGEQVTAWVAKWNAAHPDSAPVQPQTPAPAQPAPQQPQPQTIKQAPAAVVIPMVDDADELEGAPF